MTRRKRAEVELSRELSCHVGRGRRFADVHAHGRFLEQLDVTCFQATLIVRDYAGDWYSKYKFEDGISRRAVGIFVETAFTKMRAELKRRGQGWQPEPASKGDADAA